MKFSALNADFSGQSVDFLGLRRPAHASVKKGTRLKSVYFTDIASSSMKTVADRRRHFAYDNKR